MDCFCVKILGLYTRSSCMRFIFSLRRTVRGVAECGLSDCSKFVDKWRTISADGTQCLRPRLLNYRRVKLITIVFDKKLLNFLHILVISSTVSCSKEYIQCEQELLKRFKTT